MKLVCFISALLAFGLSFQAVFALYYVSADLTTPHDMHEGDTVSTKVYLTNTDEDSAFVNLTAYLCRKDGTHCIIMDCGDNTVHVAKRTSYSLSCSADAWESGYHNIKLDLGYGNRVYSNAFNIEESVCAAAYMNSYTCSNNWRQRLYQTSDCTQEWRDYEYCSGGCTSGRCVKAIALVSLEDSYEAKPCEVSDIDFGIVNTGDTTATYNISVEGVDWVYALPSVTLEPNKRKTVTAYASVPCSAAGSYDFSVSVSDGTANKVNSVLKIIGRESTAAGTDYSGTAWDIALVLLVALVAILFIRAFLKKPGCRAWRRLWAEEKF